MGEGEGMATPVGENKDYEKRVSGERRHFEGLANFSALPEIVNWWSSKYLAPRIQQLLGYSGGHTFYLNPILAAAAKNKRVTVASIGSGDGEVENALAKLLHEKNIRNVKIVGFELSSELVSKAKNKANALGVSKTVSFKSIDVNKSFASSKFDLIIANQVLHHIINLEQLLDSCHASLKDDGLLMTRDMIGKNGHQCWPEAKIVVDKIWSEMPERYKLNCRNGENSAEFPNIDFSKWGFERTRSQDILPLINERFGYSHFYAFGGIVERFINRAYGPNYSSKVEEDTDFVDGIQKINDELIDNKKITPTQMVAYFSKRKLPGQVWLGSGCIDFLSAA